MKTRRDFIVKSAVAATGLTLGMDAFARQGVPVAQSSTHVADISQLKISVFSKNLQWLSYERMAEAAAAMGFDGIDITVRANGHVLPDRVETDLPKAVAAIRNKGLDVYMITTAINNAAEPITERIIKTAAGLGIKHYRLGWFSYNKSASIAQNIQTFNQTFHELQNLNKKYKVHGAYQNHAGESFGSPVIDFAMALNNINPAWIGCQYDIRHATVEGANSWPIGLNMVKDYVKTVNIKDFKWTQKDGVWNVENVPLGEGMVNFKRYFELLKSYKFTGPICIHYEYALGGAEDGANKITVEPETVYKAMRTDLAKLKRWLSETS